MWQPLLLVALLLQLTHSAADAYLHNPLKHVCASMEINSFEEFAQLRNCTIVVGYVRLAKVEFTVQQLEHLNSQLLEITDYLIVYRLDGLYTLKSVFPRLRIIRGKQLFLDKYSLIVYENRNLRELGLVELLRIQAGSVRIEANPMLCFTETINWVYLVANRTTQHCYVKDNKSPNHCPVCDGQAADYAYRENGTKYCWNSATLQLMPTPILSGSACPENCGVNGCDPNGFCCQRDCLTGCYISGCELCANYRHRATNKCVNQCIASFALHKRECISGNECRKLKMIPFDGECVEACPDNHQPGSDENGHVHCYLNCTGNFFIKTAKDLRPLYGCVTIKGSLTIELKDIKEKIIAELERALVFVKEIRGYLKILRSHSLMSLNFLKNLDTIGGEQLLDNKYALFVVDNHHLEEIWAVNQQVAIHKGTIYFHLNPRLCYNKIQAIEISLKSVHKVSIADVSPNSNGERVICGESLRELEAKVEDINATAVRIAVGIMNSEDLEILLGYTYHYKEAPVRNVTMYDGRHGCGHDDWLMDVTASTNRRHVIANLKPYTQYAYFVKTLTRTDYHMQIDAYSKIQYFRTLPSRPTAVAKIYADSPSTTEIMLHWWPPRRANGVINKYIVHYEKLGNTNATIRVENFTLTNDCDCAEGVPYNSGPLPDDENYYDKEQITYEEALPNLMYVRRRNKDEPKKEKFNRILDYTALDITTPRPTTPKPLLLRPANNAHNMTTALNRTSNFTIQAVRSYQLYREQLERKAVLAQDNGIEHFPILKSPAICGIADKNSATTNCEVRENYLGIKVPGQQHYLLLNHLEPKQMYRLTVRACVEDLVNGCSPPTAIVAQTASKNIEEFLKSLHDYY